jgi:hypothetical protein
MIDPAHTLVSEATQDRLAHAEFEMKCASEEYYLAWMAYHRELYAKAEAASAHIED